MAAVKIGDSIGGLWPSFYTQHDVEREHELEQAMKQRKPLRQHPVRNRVEWIHPKGRFVVIRFIYDGGSFCECKTLHMGRIV